MGNLLRSDFYRIRKDKLFFWGVLIAALCAFFLPLIRWALFTGINTLDSELLSVNLDAASFFFSAFNISDVMYNIAPILIVIILFKDFRQGTIRNKIITGTRRSTILFSTYISITLSLACTILLYAFITLGTSLLIMPPQSDLTWSAFWYYVGSVMLSLNLLLFVSALLTYICVSSKGLGGVLLKYLAIVNLLPFVTGILSSAVTGMELSGNQGTLYKILDAIQNINVYNYSSYIGIGDGYETTQLIFLIATPLALTVLLLCLGNRKLRKKYIA